MPWRGKSVRTKGLDCSTTSATPSSIRRHAAGVGGRGCVRSATEGDIRHAAQQHECYACTAFSRSSSDEVDDTTLADLQVAVGPNT